MRLRPASPTGPPPTYAYDPCILTATRSVEVTCVEHGSRLVGVCDAHWFEIGRSEPFICRYCREPVIVAAR
jgi:hypothetical protein